MADIEEKFSARDYGYTVISRFETLLRNHCYKVISINYSNKLDSIPKGVIDAANKRNSEEKELAEVLENIDFIHLKEIIVYKNNYDMHFDCNRLPSKEFISLMDGLYEIRCKIAHIRGYLSKLDLVALIEGTEKIVINMNGESKEYITFLRLLQNNPEGLIAKIPVDFLCAEQVEYKILNNIPPADYEYEGGFVGRSDDKNKITKMLEDGVHRVITISGAGGVGKSALAVNIVKEILEKDLIKFDSVIWVSAKENRLTYLGIEDIEPTLKSYEELLDTILEVMGFDYNAYNSIDEKIEDINILFDSCNRVLIVIDNLETITDERIINFILDSHPNTTILITSRKGLGQVERRHDLKELKEKEAIRLFRLISQEKNLENLRTLEDNIIKKYVNKVYCYPLAIKWVLGQAAVGKDINDIIDTINENTSDISMFCFEQIYNGLTYEAKLILCTLSFFEDSVTKGVIKYISNLDALSFEDSISDLVLVSLIILEQKLNKENKEINAAYSLLPLTRGYVRVQLDTDPNLKRIIQERIVTVENTMEEAERAKNQYRFSLSNLGANGEEEKVAAMLAQTAYQKYQAGNYLESVETYKKAINIAPRFASVYRNWAIMESNEEHWIEADNLMKQASRFSPEDTQIWLVWGNIKKKNDRIKEAYQYYKKAYELSPSDNVVLNLMGQALGRQGEHKLADEYLQKALNSGEELPQTKHLIINKTCIAENLKRWAESLVEDRNYGGAEEKLEIALDNMKEVIELDEKDNRSCILYREILLDLGFLCKRSQKDDLALKYFEEIIGMPAKKYKEFESILRATLAIITIHINNNNMNDAKKLMNKELERICNFIRKPKLTERYEKLHSIVNDNEKRIHGKIINWNIPRKFGIIENLNCDGETFLAHISDFKNFINPLETEMQNKEVAFIPLRDTDKNIAKNIIIIDKSILSIDDVLF